MEVDTDIERLGVVAVGMFNRRSLSIDSHSLDDDLIYYRLTSPTSGAAGRQLTQSELLLGGFFFVHQSVSGGRPDNTERVSDSAFEFLHNTFGEFLAADFLLRRIFVETDMICSLRKDPGVQDALGRRLQEPDPFWFANLMHVPLFSRPVIIEMMREWLAARLDMAAGRSRSDFDSAFSDVVGHQLESVASGYDVPKAMRGMEKDRYGHLPVLGYMATYSLNLVLLQAILCVDGFRMADPDGGTSEGETGSWEQLTYLWRSWFSLDALSGLSSIVNTRRDSAGIHVAARSVFHGSVADTRLDVVRDVAMSLGDQVMGGLASVVRTELGPADEDDIQDATTMLMAEGIRAEPLLALAALRAARRHDDRDAMVAALRMWAENINPFGLPFRHDLSEVLEAARSVGERRLAEFIVSRALDAARYARSSIGIEIVRALLDIGSTGWLDDRWAASRELYEVMVETLSDVPPRLAVDVLRFGWRLNQGGIAGRIAPAVLERYFASEAFLRDRPQAMRDAVEIALALGNPEVARSATTAYLDRFKSFRPPTYMAVAEMHALTELAVHAENREILGLLFDSAKDERGRFWFNSAYSFILALLVGDTVYLTYLMNRRDATAIKAELRTAPSWLVFEALRQAVQLSDERLRKSVIEVLAPVFADGGDLRITGTRPRDN
jgi:hypothetical protein